MTTFGADPNYQKKLAAMLMQQGVDASPVQHWTQGAARMAQALVGGNMMRSEREADDEANRNAMASLLGGSQSLSAAQPMQQQQPAAQPVSNPQSWANAISGIESGGRYDALGPVTKSGDRAYGKYQVMGANVPQWTKAHLGQEMTPEQFLANAQAQDAVFKGQFGQYAQKYGPEGASRAWFAGEGGMNNPNAKDQLGTTVAQYAQKFTGGLPGQQAQAAPQMAQAPQIDRNAAMSAILNPRVRPEVKQMLLQQITPDNQVMAMPDGTVVRIDKRSGATQELYKAKQKPTFGVIGKDDFGNEQYGWTNASDQSVTPVQSQSKPLPAAAPAGQSVVPPVPPGADPKVWRKETTEAAAKAATELPGAIAKGEQSLQLIDQMLTHPGRGTATGLSSVLDPRNYLPGTDAKDFQIRQKQVLGRSFLEAFESLKGGGQITEAEGRKATEAIARLDLSQSDAEYEKSLRDLRDVIASGLQRSRSRAGQPAAPVPPAPETAKPPPTPPAGAQTAINPKTGERLILKDGKWVPFS